MVKSSKSAGSAGEPSDAVTSLPAIADVVDQYYERLYRYAFRLTGSATDAEDLVQQTLLMAHQKLHQVREPERLNGWLMTVLRTRFLKHQQKRRPVLASNLELDIDGVPDRANGHAWFDAELLQSALCELPDEFRIVLLMFYFEQLSYKEIATALELPVGTVMSRLSRAKGRLRQKLMVSGGGCSPPHAWNNSNVESRKSHVEQPATRTD